MQTVPCPCCGVLQMKPRPSTRSTYWTDTCACSDLGRCVAHQISPEETPDRPSNEEMLKRAYAQAEAKEPRWLELQERFKIVKAFLESL